MKREQDWTDVLRSRLRDAETPPPAEGWERLRRELPAVAPPSDGTSGPARKEPPRLGDWRWRTAAAAAVVALCLGTGELLRHTALNTQPSGPERQLLGQRSETQSAPVRFSTEPTTQEQEETLARKLGLKPASPAVAPLAHRTHLETPPPDTPHAANEHPQESSERRQPSIGSPADDDAANTSATRPATRRDVPVTHTGTASSPATRFGDDRSLRRPARRTASLALFAGGGISARLGETAPVTQLQQSSSLSWGYNNVGEFGNDRVTLARKEDYRNSEFRHRQPLSVGFTVRKEFTHGLSLESGLIYTLLRSDVRMPYSAEELRQQLHFIGIPLRMNWRFVERNGFSLYMGTGGMVEKCVSARLGDSSVPEKELQWSLSAAVGAEYRFGGPVGLYFEPDLSYYLTSTNSCTARTESPFNVSLRLGLRLTF